MNATADGFYARYGSLKNLKAEGRASIPPQTLVLNSIPTALLARLMDLKTRGANRAPLGTPAGPCRTGFNPVDARLTAFGME